MSQDRRRRRLHSLGFVVLLGACGSGGGNDEANINETAEGPDDRVAGQSIDQARFDQASFSSASFAAELSSGRFGTDKFR